MLPEGYLESLAQRESGSPATRFRALQNLGVTYALVGAYRDQIEIDREAKALRPRARQPHSAQSSAWSASIRKSSVSAKVPPASAQVGVVRRETRMRAMSPVRNQPSGIASAVASGWLR